MNHGPISQELRLLKAIEMLIRVDFLYTQEIVTSENDSTESVFLLYVTIWLFGLLTMVNGYINYWL